MSQITYKELCKTLKVSRATLDRVINDRSGVGDARRQEILKQIEEIGFKPNSVGKALAMQKRAKFGVIVSSDLTPKGNDLFVLVRQGMEYAEQKLRTKGANFEFVTLVSGQAEEQIEAVERMLRSGVSGIAISMEAVSSKLMEVIHRAMEMQVKFVFYFNVCELLEAPSQAALPEQQYFEIKPDNRREGLMAGALMGNYLGGEGTVAVLSGLVKNKVHQSRTDSAVEKLTQEFPHIRTLGVIRNCYPEQRVRDVIGKLLEQYPDLSGIIASCGNNVEIIEQLKQHGKHEQVRTIFFDCTQMAEKSLADGDVDVLLGVDLFKMGYKTVNALYNLVISNEVNPVEADLPLLVKTKEWF